MPPLHICPQCQHRFEPNATTKARRGFTSEQQRRDNKKYYERHKAELREKRRAREAAKRAGPAQSAA